MRASLVVVRYYVHDRHAGWYYSGDPKDWRGYSVMDYCGPRLSKEQKERIKKLMAVALSW